MSFKKFLAVGACSLAFVTGALAASERIGSVDTTFRWLGSNDKIVIEAFDDPRVPGVSCHLSRALKGGLDPFAEDGSDASLACRQTGPVSVLITDLKKYEQEDVFSASQNVWFKSMKVKRFVDVKRNTIVYLTFSTKLIDGSPKNAISSVPLMPWPGK